MTNRSGLAVLAAVVLSAVAAAQDPGAASKPAQRADIVLADFDGIDYGNWKVEGEAFGKAPRQGDNGVWPYQGTRFAWSMNGGDRTLGTLTSPEFRIERRYMTFLISGGNHPGETCINLMVDGKVARTATGADHEWMIRCLWDLGDLAGKTATVQIVDKHNGNWGHINIDHVVLTDEKRLSPWTYFEAKDDACTRLPLYLQPPRNAKGEIPPMEGEICGWKFAGKLFGPEVGRMTSVEFKIDRKFLNFYCMPFGEMTVQTLRVGDEVVAASAYGPPSSDGWRCWDVSAYIGKTGRFEIIDRHFVNLPQIPRLAVFLSDVELPCTQLVEQFKDPKLIASRLPDQPLKYDSATDEKVVDDTSSDYTEKYRPQFHFSMNHGHMNDPNGLLWYDGEYHLFMQHAGGWGHAVSKDLVHWVQLQQALSADNLGACWSGSAVVDWNNTSGFQTGKEKVLVALYACYKRIRVNPTEEYSRQFQCIAYSNDRGRTWTKYAGNPVIPEQDRDPKMFWHEPTRSWRMVLYQCPPGRSFWSSKDLKHWTKEGGDWFGSECPDLFELPIAGEPGKTKWVSVDGRGQYLIGEFDGKTHKQEVRDRLTVEYGENHYATQAFNDIPKSDGRCIQITWMNGGNPYPETPTAGQQMTFPRELTLRRTPDGLRLYAVPVREIEKLRKTEHKWKDLTLAPGENPLAGLKGDLFDVRMEVEPGDAAELGLRVRGEEIAYNVKDAKLTCCKSQDGRQGVAPVALEQGRLKLQVLVDRVSLETFAQDGRATISAKFMPDGKASPLDLFARGGKAKVISLTVYELNSAWTPPPRKDRTRAQGGFIKLGPIAESAVDIGRLVKGLRSAKVGVQNWQLADDAVINWRKGDPEDFLCEPDQVALPRWTEKRYYLLAADVVSKTVQDVEFETPSTVTAFCRFSIPQDPSELVGIQDLMMTPRIEPLPGQEERPSRLRARVPNGKSRIILVALATGPLTIRALKPRTDERAEVEFLPSEVDSAAAPYTPAAVGPITRKTLVGKWKGKMTLKLPPAASMDAPHPDPGISTEARKLLATDADERDLEVVPAPSGFGQYSEGWWGHNGEAVLRRTVVVPREWAGKDLLLSLGAVDDFDDTFFNGEFVGRIDKNTDRFFAAPRRYRIAAKLVKEGANVVAVRVFDHFGGGGMTGPAEEMFIEPAK